MAGMLFGDQKEIRCQGCGTEITWAPVVMRFAWQAEGKRVEAQHYYCCQDCLEGRGCDCGVRMEVVGD
jgi:hypothetical protein